MTQSTNLSTEDTVVQVTRAYFHRNSFSWNVDSRNIQLFTRFFDNNSKFHPIIIQIQISFKMSTFLSLITRILLIVVFVKVTQILCAPADILVVEEIPVLWCAEDYPIVDQIDAYPVYGNDDFDDGFDGGDVVVGEIPPY